MIGISEDRLHHIIGVARECYNISKELGRPETFCRKMFTIGWNHDIGYEFVEDSKQHAGKSEDMLKLIGLTGLDYDSQRTRHAIRSHGRTSRVNSMEWYILNKADMTIDNCGNKVTYEERLNNIKERYGEDSTEYKSSKEVVDVLKYMDSIKLS